MSHINRLIKEIILEKRNLLRITQLTILLFCIFTLIFKDFHTGIFTFIMILLSLVLGILSLLLSSKSKACDNSVNCETLLKTNYNYVRDMKGLLREQRHDYMNFFQVIYGYLQLKKCDKATEQIKKIISLSNNISTLYNVSTLSISLLIEKKMKEADNQGVGIICNVDSYITQEYRIALNEKQIIVKLASIFDFILIKIDKFHNNILNINISEYDDRIEFIFKGNLSGISESSILSIKNDALVSDEQIKLIFSYEKFDYVNPEDTIYYSILNNV